MPASGTVVAVRMPDELLSAIESAVSELRDRSPGEPPTRNGFIVKAIRDALSKRERSRTWRKRRGGKSQGGIDGPAAV